MSKEYSSHTDYMLWVSADADERQFQITLELREAFASFIERQEVEVIHFTQMSVIDVATAIVDHPSVLKPLLAICNIAARAIERDLQLKGIDTYRPRLDEQKAAAIAGYLTPFLPAYAPLSSLGMVDRVAFIDKEIRKGKGRWERQILQAANRYGNTSFKKRRFLADNEIFELDVAAPTEGPILIGIDVKRIEARRDIHKRCDEIITKADKLKQAFSQAIFAAIIYYPFIEEHINIQSRLRSANIDFVSFASESPESTNNAVRLLLDQMGVADE